MSSRRPQSAKQNRSTGEPTPDRLFEAALTILKNNKTCAASKSLQVGRGGTVLRTAPRRARDLAKRHEAQGASGDARHEVLCPDIRNGRPYEEFQKIDLMLSHLFSQKLGLTLGRLDVRFCSGKSAV